MSKLGLKDAYSVKEPEDNVRLYRDWAGDYDTEFVRSHGYVMPRELARIFSAEGGQGPILDIGAGTGLVAEELAAGGIDGSQIDAIDISAEMLEVARQKGLYRQRLVADLTEPLSITDASYSGMISAGTFTHGHVGPGCLPELLRIAAPGALFVVSINEGVFDEAGFGSAFANLVADDAISAVEFKRIRYYEGVDHEHAEDEGLVAVFRKR